MLSAVGSDALQQLLHVGALCDCAGGAAAGLRRLVAVSTGAGWGRSIQARPPATSTAAAIIRSVRRETGGMVNPGS